MPGGKRDPRRLAMEDHYEVITGVEMVGRVGGDPNSMLATTVNSKRYFQRRFGTYTSIHLRIRHFINTRSSSAVPEHLVKRRNLKGLVLVGDPTYTFTREEN